MFGERLMQLRKRSGLSQNELAEAMGISRQAISKYENNLAEPDLQKIQQFTMILGVSYADLLGNEPPEPKPAANRPSSAITITSLINEAELKQIQEAMLRGDAVYHLAYTAKVNKKGMLGVRLLD